MTKWCCIGLWGKTMDETDGEKETCVWFSLGFFTWWRYTNPSLSEKTLCTPIGSCYTREEISQAYEMRTVLHGACTPCGCYEVRRDSNGAKEITLGTICCKTTSLVTPQQVTMTQAKI
jgi:hypothetical protein